MIRVLERPFRSLLGWRFGTRGTLPRYKHISSSVVDESHNQIIWSTFSKEEEGQYQALRKEFKKDWKAIAERMPGRIEQQIKLRYLNEILPSHPGQSWTMDEDFKLIRLRKYLGLRWDQISSEMMERTTSALKFRWKYHINFNVNENWTRSEEDQLRLLHKSHGNRWNVISEQIGTKSPKQCFVRFIELEREIHGDTYEYKARKSQWTAKEDQRLRAAVKKHSYNGVDMNSVNVWDRIANDVTGRSGADCRVRWHSGLSNSLRIGEWTEEEDRRLLELVGMYGNKWQVVAKILQTRSMRQCKRRYETRLSPDYRRDAWTVAEDQQLQQLYAEYGPAWKKIGIIMGNRHRLDVRTRHAKLLRPAVPPPLKRYVTWSPEEVEILKRAVHENDGRDWYKIAQALPGRTSRQCSKKFRGLNETNLVWTAAMDQRLADAVEKLGTSNWAAIADMIPGRTGKECRSRWFCYVYRNLNTAPWTKEEDDYIVKSYQLGKSWASITAAIPGRTKDAIQQRFNDVLKPTLSLPVERRWSESEDQLLINAMSKETALKIDWVRVSNIVSCKSIRQCQGRWTVLLRLKRAPPRTVRVTPLLTKPESTDVPEPSVA